MLKKKSKFRNIFGHSRQSTTRKFTWYFLFFCILSSNNILQAQLPCTPSMSGLFYMHNGTSLYNCNPALPLSATNPFLNTIALPAAAAGLAVCENINGPGPSPTFYTTLNGTYHYYNGSGWTNTGHTAGAVNPAGGGGYLYSLEGGGGNVYKYSGTGNATLLLTVPGFSAGGPFDLVVDCSGNFYILRTSATGWLRKYSPTGALLQEWTISGGGSGGGGLAIIGNMLYYNSATTMYSGIIGATNVAISTVAGTIPNAGDFGSCTLSGGNAVTLNDTVFNCVPSAPQTITASGSAPYSYTVINGTATVTGSGPSYQVTNTQPATIVLQSINNVFCGNTAYDTILVVPAPTVDAGLNDTVSGCATYIDTLHGTLSNTTSWITYNLSWSPAAAIISGGSTTTPVIAPAANTTFTLTAATSAAQGNCNISDSVHIAVKNESVSPDFSFAIHYGCDADTVLFTNTSTLSNTSAWDFGDGFLSTANNPAHIYNAQGIYGVKLVVSNYLCKDSVTKTINTTHPLQASFTSDKDTLCDNGTVGFTNTSTISVLPGTFFWNFGDGGTSNVMNPSHYYATPGTYQVMLVASDAVPCRDTAYDIIVVDNPPSLDFTLSDHDICTGQYITVAANYTQSGNTGLDWNFGDGNTAYDIAETSHAYDQPGTYFITLTGKYRICDPITKRDSVNVHPMPRVFIGSDTVICPYGDPLWITNRTAGPASERFLWSTGDTSRMLKVAHHGSYNLLVTTAEGCTAMDEIVIDKDCYIDIPNSFTPNNDGVNDYFFPRQLMGKSIRGFKMQIFNRWGQIVFETTQTDGRGWNGNFNDKQQAAGVYIYQINVVYDQNRTEHYNGNVTLLR